jgi:mannosyltransferase
MIRFYALEGLDGLPRKSLFAAGVVSVLALGLWLRIVGLGREGLWLDEIYSASFTNLSPFQLVVAVLRFDVHPPLYYLQLKAWSLFGHDDLQLMLNSVLWSMAAMAAVLVGATRRFGPRVGLLAMAFCAVMGSEIYFANELRMYALFGFLVVLSWIFADRIIADYRFKTALPLAAVLATLAALHSLAVIAISAVLIYVFPWGDVSERRRRVWIGLVLFSAIALIPWLTNAFFRHVTHPEQLSLAGVTRTVGGWFSGYGMAAVPAPVHWCIAVLTAACLATALVTTHDLRRIVLCFVVWPLAAGAVLCLAVRPIWLDRVFAFCAPFVAITLATLTVRRLERGRAAAFGAACFALAFVLVAGWLGHVQATTERKTQFREAATYLQQHAVQGEIVYIPSHNTFWGMARYLIGPEWGSPLRVQDPSNPDRSDKWPWIYSRLGMSRLENLGLAPETRRLDGFKVPLYVGWSPLPEAKTMDSWVVGQTYDRLDLNTLELCPEHHIVLREFRLITLYHVHCGNPASVSTSPVDTSQCRNWGVLGGALSAASTACSTSWVLKGLVRTAWAPASFAAAR